MIGRPSLLFLTALSAGAAAVGNAVGIAAVPPVAEQAGKTRLGEQIAQDLSQRDRQAAERGRALDLREQAARAAEARLKAQGPAAPVAADPASAPNAAPVPNQYDDLARIYQAMKPAAAALVMERLDLDVQMQVAQRMRERSTAQILAAMTPKGAASLTMAMARRGVPRPMPSPKAMR